MARKFNGTSDSMAVTLPFSASTKCTISFWANWASFTSSDLRMVYSSLSGNVGGIAGFDCNPSRSSSPANGFDVAMTKGSGGAFWEDQIPRPSTGAWHHIMITHDRTVPVNAVWVDGASQSLTTVSHTSNTYSTFADATLTFCKYNVTFLAMALAEWAIWNTVLLTGAAAKGLATGASPFDVHPDNLLAYLPLYGVDSPEPDYSGGKHSGTLTGTTWAAHPPVAPGMFPHRGFQPMPV